MIKVASYCRVSTDKNDQSNSFETQQSYFRDYIRSHPGWELYQIYADEGITGTSTKKRTQFNRMINDAYEGKFQMIITKEVSRFSRNLLDTIAYTRELKTLGIGVIFSTDQINSLEPDAEMILSFYASMAQEESRRTSSRVVWGQTRQMEKGIVFGTSLLGYDITNGTLRINQKGAETVRVIFDKYAVEQVGTTEIARFLSDKGYVTRKGNTKWSASTILKILNNEKYVGDLVQKKTYTPDYLTHEKKCNRGNVPLIVLKNHHEPIVSREVWNLTQERLRCNNKRKEGSGGHSNRYLFSGKIRCGECGNSFVSRVKYRKDGSKIRRWICGTAVREGLAGCDIGKLIRDDDALQILKTAIRSLQIDSESIIKEVTGLSLEGILAEEASTKDDPERIQKELCHVQQKKEAVMDSYFSQDITKEDMQAMVAKYEQQIKILRGRMEEAMNLKENGRSFSDLHTRIQTAVTAFLSCEKESEVFYKILIQDLTVFKDRHLELRLKYIPQIFHFQG